MKVSFQYSEKFDVINEYKGNDLGIFCNANETIVKLWAPFAEKVKLYLYSDGGTAMELDSKSKPDNPIRCIELHRLEQGVWGTSLPESLHGVWYDYVITENGEDIRTADPYAKACAPNGCRSMVVDLSKTNPPGFELDKSPSVQKENIIYELHIKDFSASPDSGVPKEYRGKYKAFTLEGESVACINHLKSLGVTHVHLLPFFDYGFLDETGDSKQFNWGYDPLNYNVPEGFYATDVYDGTVRIRECKEMIQALHRAGIRVIMDVVYNHTHEVDSWLERTAPGYFCRRNEDGTLTNGSACGNDMAVGRAMVDNYIYNSVLYWAEEYHLDGFRFDLMGLLTVELMNRIGNGLDEIYGLGEKLIYGEPWSAGESLMEKGTYAALKDNVALLNKDIAIFCDDIRDSIKGDVFLETAPGFVNGGKGFEKKLQAVLEGFEHVEGHYKPLCSGQIVNYVSAHDNFTLWDKLLTTMTDKRKLVEEKDYLAMREEVLRANKLVALIYFTCQGNLFFQAGEEFGRTKFGDENSYRSDEKVNMLRWEQREAFRELVDYYRGLIRLRKKLPGLCDKSEDCYRRIENCEIVRDGVFAFEVNQRDLDASWKRLHIIYNASQEAEKLRLEAGEWYILANNAETDICVPAEEEVEVAALSGVVLAVK